MALCNEVININLCHVFFGKVKFSISMNKNILYLLILVCIALHKFNVYSTSNIMVSFRKVINNGHFTKVL